MSIYTFPCSDNTEVLDLDIFNVNIKINNVFFHNLYLEDDYLNKKININNNAIPKIAQLLRILVTDYPNMFFLENDKILDELNKDINKLPVFIEIDNWIHPDIFSRNDKYDITMPSDSLSFQLLSDALFLRNENIYNVDNKLCNNHWFFWE